MTTLTDTASLSQVSYDRLRSRLLTVLTHTHTYSGRDDHGGTLTPPESYRRLADWASARGIDLLGMGSPYTPETIGDYHRFDGEDRETYYADPHAMTNGRLSRQRESTTRMIAEVNAASDGRSLFYLDNETPKARFGHMWWMGWHDDAPAWHDYDQPFDRWMLESPEARDHGDEPMPYERRPYAEIVATQRAHGAVGVWAHPTSWWFAADGRFVTNIASEMPAHAFADGYLDGIVAMGYRADRPDYRRIWYGLLDHGVRVPGMAEMDIGLSRTNIDASPGTYLTAIPKPADGVAGLDACLRAVRAGDLISTSGPLADITVDGVRPGGVVTTARGVGHRVRVEIATVHGRPLDHVRLVGHGDTTLWSEMDVATGEYTIDIEGRDERGYVVLEALGEPDEVGRATQVVISAPIYLHPAGTEFRQPAETELRLCAGPGTWAEGCRFRVESAEGDLVTTGRISVNSLVETVPANSRVVLVPDNAAPQSHWLLTANPALRDLQRYLYRGRFLRDFNGLNPGQLPLEAWRLDDYEQVLRSADLVLGWGDPADVPRRLEAEGVVSRWPGRSMRTSNGEGADA